MTAGDHHSIDGTITRKRTIPFQGRSQASNDKILSVSTVKDHKIPKVCVSEVNYLHHVLRLRQ